MQLCLTEYTNLKKCPLVTQIKNTVEIHSSTAFKVVVQKKKKKIVSEQQIFNSPLLSPTPEKHVFTATSGT